jgi:hypothetical protein
MDRNITPNFQAAKYSSVGEVGSIIVEMNLFVPF